MFRRCATVVVAVAVLVAGGLVVGGPSSPVSSPENGPAAAGEPPAHAATAVQAASAAAAAMHEAVLALEIAVDMLARNKRQGRMARRWLGENRVAEPWAFMARAAYLQAEEQFARAVAAGALASEEVWRARVEGVPETADIAEHLAYTMATVYQELDRLNAAAVYTSAATGFDRLRAARRMSAEYSRGRPVVDAVRLIEVTVNAERPVLQAELVEDRMRERRLARGEIGRHVVDDAQAMADIRVRQLEADIAELESASGFAPTLLGSLARLVTTIAGCALAGPAGCVVGGLSGSAGTMVVSMSSMPSGGSVGTPLPAATLPTLYADGATPNPRRAGPGVVSSSGRISAPGARRADPASGGARRDATPSMVALSTGDIREALPVWSIVDEETLALFETAEREVAKEDAATAVYEAVSASDGVHEPAERWRAAEGELAVKDFLHAGTQLMHAAASLARATAAVRYARAMGVPVTGFESVLAHVADAVNTSGTRLSAATPSTGGGLDPWPLARRVATGRWRTRPVIDPVRVIEIQITHVMPLLAAEMTEDREQVRRIADSVNSRSIATCSNWP